MASRSRIRPIDLMVVATIAVYCGYQTLSGPRERIAAPSTFARQVRLDPFFKTAVQADGRLRSFESHAKTYMGYVSGPRAINGQSNAFTYLDLAFRPEKYADVDIIYIKNKNVRAQILDVLKMHSRLDESRASAMLSRGLISPGLLRRPEVVALLQRLGQDLIRTSKAVDVIQSALSVSEPGFLQDNLRMVAAPSGLMSDPWLSVTQVVGAGGIPLDDVHVGIRDARPVPGLNPAFQEDVARAWSTLRTAWRSEDANIVNTQVAALAGLFSTVSPHLYPSLGRLAVESWYFRNKSMTWVWLIYLASVVPLLMFVIYRWDGARHVGMVMFVTAFAFHTASLGVRWYISGRWPNANMFEAVTTSAWFGGVGALILELLARRTPFRNLFALGAAVMSMAALMAAYFLPAQLDSGINNKMAALNDVWLYIHTNMIIWSYAVIGLACVPALLQLRHRWCLAWDEGTIPKLRLLILPVAAAIFNYTAYRLLMHMMNDPARELTGHALIGVIGAFWGSVMILLLEWTAARARQAARVTVEDAAPGGAASLFLSRGLKPARTRHLDSSFLTQPSATVSQVLDGATMVLVELSFVMLWTGLVMGAVWADHSWGRPWGWDPKEVFALNTFIIFLILIHVRLKVSDKAFWTALLAVVGFEVMMFNWIVVNFVISGLHSYA